MQVCETVKWAFITLHEFTLIFRDIETLQTEINSCDLICLRTLIFFHTTCTMLLYFLL